MPDLDDSEFFLYIVSHVDAAGTHSGPIKIGITNNCTKRLQDLKTGNPQRIDFYAIHPMQSQEEASNAEKILHRLLDNYRLYGEWFDYSPDKVVSVVIRSLCHTKKHNDDYKARSTQHCLDMMYFTRREEFLVTKFRDLHENGWELYRGFMDEFRKWEPELKKWLRSARATWAKCDEDDE